MESWSNEPTFFLIHRAGAWKFIVWDSIEYLRELLIFTLTNEVVQWSYVSIQIVCCLRENLFLNQKMVTEVLKCMFSYVKEFFFLTPVLNR